MGLPGPMHTPYLSPTSHALMHASYRTCLLSALLDAHSTHTRFCHAGLQPVFLPAPNQASYLSCSWTLSTHPLPLYMPLRLTADFVFMWKKALMHWSCTEMPDMDFCSTCRQYREYRQVVSINPPQPASRYLTPHILLSQIMRHSPSSHPPSHQKSARPRRRRQSSCEATRRASPPSSQPSSRQHPLPTFPSATPAFPIRGRSASIASPPEEEDGAAF